MSGKLPAIQFYPGDWLRDNVAGCSLAAQGLWLRMMILAHDSERYGYLVINGSPMSPEFIARKCGSTLAEYESLMNELNGAGIPSRTTDGIIYSRRMVRDAVNRAQGAKRLKKHRKAMETEDSVKRSCNGDVTPLKRSSSSSISSSPSDSGGSTPHTPPARESKVIRQRVKRVKPKLDDPGPTGFAAFWNAYPNGPRKVDRLGCLDRWLNRELESSADAILAGLARWKTSHHWRKEGEQFVCAPAVFLNQRRWDTDPSHSGDNVAGRIGPHGPHGLCDGTEMSADELRRLIDEVRLGA